MSSPSFSFTEVIKEAGRNDSLTDLTVQLKDLHDYPLDPTAYPPPAMFVSAKYRQFAQQVRDFEVHPDDTWIITFPRSGTTWTEEMVWLLNHDLDYETARNIQLNTRSTFLELGAIANRYPINTIDVARDSQRPRQIKSHLHLSLLPRQLWTVKPRIIYVARNPKDVAVSYLHHYRVFVDYGGTKEAFYDALLENRIVYCPMVEHALHFWQLKDAPNVLFLTYESMKRDLRGVLEKVCHFLHKSYSGIELTELALHLSFEQMRKNPATNKHETVRHALKQSNREGEKFEFMRKGIVGDYRNEMPAEYIARFNQFVWVRTAGTDFKYYDDELADGQPSAVVKQPAEPDMLSADSK